MSPDSRSIPVWLWLVIWIACVGVTLAIQPASMASRDLNARQVLASSSKDREAIAANWEEYKQLSGTERASVKKLHSDLQTENQLKSVLKEFLDWRELANRQFPDQVAKLDAESDPVRKAQIVERIVNDQKTRMKEMLQIYSGDSADLREPREPREVTMRRGLSRMELEALREALEPAIKPLLNSEEWTKVESSEGLARTVRVLSAAVELMRNGRMRESGRRPDEIYRKLQETLGRGPVADLLEQQVTSEGKAGALRSLILAGLMRQVSSEPFTPEELEAARKKATTDNPRINSAPPHFRDFWIKVTAINAKYPEFSRLFERQMKESGGFGFGPPFGGRPPFGPPGENRDDRPRRGPEGRGPEGRGPEGRGPDRRPPDRGADGPRAGGGEQPPPPPKKPDF